MPLKPFIMKKKHYEYIPYKPSSFLVCFFEGASFFDSEKEIRQIK